MIPIPHTQQAPQLHQKMMLSAHMQQALHVLQLPIDELEVFLEEQIALNPMFSLEECVVPNTPVSKDGVHRAQQLHEREQELITAPVSWIAPIQQQLWEMCSSKKEKNIGRLLLGSLERTGLLTTSLAEIACFEGCSEEDVERVLALLQSCEPPGIGARSPQEALLLQLQRKHLQQTLAYKILTNHYEDFLHNRFSAICRKERCSQADVHTAIHEHILPLSPYPGLRYSDQHHKATTIRPDLTITEQEGALYISVRDPFSLRFALDRHYLDLLHQESDRTPIKTFLTHALHEAEWLRRTVDTRKDTLEKIGTELIRVQKDFFLTPDGPLQPLTMKSIATSLGLHESTVARAVANKYLVSPRGTLSLRSFFSYGYTTAAGKDVSVETIKEQIARVIHEEDSQHPLSDASISEHLLRLGLPCARRTVTKHRQAMGIGTARQRLSGKQPQK